MHEKEGERKQIRGDRCVSKKKIVIARLQWPTNGQ